MGVPLTVNVAPVKFVPVMVTTVPPIVGPEAGLTVVMVGAATYVNALALVTAPPRVVRVALIDPG